MCVGGRRGLEERIGGRKGRISRKGKERRKEEKLVSEPERGSHYWVELIMAIHVPSSPTFPQVVSLMSHKYVYKDVYVTAAEVVRMVLAYLKEDKCRCCFLLFLLSSSPSCFIFLCLSLLCPYSP